MLRVPKAIKKRIIGWLTIEKMPSGADEYFRWATQ